MFRSKEHSRGFTIVELLVVIIVIGILASLIVVSYNGVQKKALETSLKADLQGSASQMTVFKSNHGLYPTSSEAQGKLKKTSEGSVLTYVPLSGDFCILGTSTSFGGVSFYIMGNSGKLETGTCPPPVIITTTVAGSTTPGYANGTGANVQFNFYNGLDNNYGVGIDTDKEGNLYIADHGNNVIRKMTPNGTVSLFAGIPQPADAGNIIGSTALTSSFNFPFDVNISTLGGEEVMLVTEKCISIIKIDQPPNYPLDIINGDSLAPHDNHYECPYLTNSGASEEYNAMFKDANSVVVDSTNTAYISEYDSDKVRKMGFDTSVNWWNGVTNLTPAGSFAYYARFGIDTQDRIYGSVGNKIIRFTTAGARSDFAGSTTAGNVNATGTAARFNDARGVDVDKDGNVYVADCGNHAIRKITSAGVVTTIAGSGVSGGVDGEGTASQFYCPTDVALTSDGLTLYVMDTVTSGNDTAGIIRKVSL